MDDEDAEGDAESAHDLAGLLRRPVALVIGRSPFPPRAPNRVVGSTPC